VSAPNLSLEERATLAAALDPSAAARAAAAEQQQGAHRRALLALDNALAEIQRLVGEITGGAQQ
jgi:hypothetical protein